MHLGHLLNTLSLLHSFILDVRIVKKWQSCGKPSRGQEIGGITISGGNITILFDMGGTRAYQEFWEG